MAHSGRKADLTVSCARRSSWEQSRRNSTAKCSNASQMGAGRARCRNDPIRVYDPHIAAQRAEARAVAAPD